MEIVNRFKNDRPTVFRDLQQGDVFKFKFKSSRPESVYVKIDTSEFNAFDLKLNHKVELAQQVPVIKLKAKIVIENE